MNPPPPAPSNLAPFAPQSNKTSNKVSISALVIFGLNSFLNFHVSSNKFAIDGD